MTMDQPFARPVMPLGSLQAFQQAQVQPAPWPIPHLLGPGLTLMTGDVFGGTSPLAYQWLLHLALGECAITGAEETQTTPQRVLYLALDASASHLSTLNEHFLAAHPGLTMPKTVLMTNTWKPLTTDEGLRELSETLTTYTDARVLVIDNLNALRPLFKGSDRKLLALLRAIAERHHLSILLLHTARASSSLATAVDHHLHLKRLPLASYYQLDVLSSASGIRSYRLHCPFEQIAFRQTTLDESLALATFGTLKALTSERLVVLRLFQACQQMLTPSQVARMLNLNEYNILKLLQKMTRAHLLASPRRHHYEISPSLQPLLDAILAQGGPTTRITRPIEIPPATEAEIQGTRKSTPKRQKARPETELPVQGDGTSPISKTPPSSEPVHILTLAQLIETQEKQEITNTATATPGYRATTASNVYLPNRAARRLAQRLERKG